MELMDGLFLYTACGNFCMIHTLTWKHYLHTSVKSVIVRIKVWIMVKKKGYASSKILTVTMVGLSISKSMPLQARFSPLEKSYVTLVPRILPSTTRVTRQSKSTTSTAAAFSPSSPVTPPRKMISKMKEHVIIIASNIWKDIEDERTCDDYCTIYLR